jgi:hypothetical protein
MRKNKIIITKLQKRILLTALIIAIDNEESFIDGHRVQWAKITKRGIPYKIVPKNLLPVVRRSQRYIKNFKQMLSLLTKE